MRLYNTAVTAMDIIFEAAQQGSGSAREMLHDLADRAISRAGRCGAGGGVRPMDETLAFLGVVFGLLIIVEFLAIGFRVGRIRREAIKQTKVASETNRLLGVINQQLAILNKGDAALKAEKLPATPSPPVGRVQNPLSIKP